MIRIIHHISHFTLLFIALTSFIFGLKYRKSHKELSHLFIYSIASFLQVLFIKVSFIFNFKNEHIEKTAIKASIFIFITIELSCLYLFFYKTKLFSKLIRKVIVYMYITFLLFYFMLLIKSVFLLMHIEYIYYIESIIILVPCFIYLFQLFIKPPTLNLLNEPSFWFYSGILIYFILTLPLFFMINYFQGKNMGNMLDIVNFLGYNLIFLFLTRAYLCKVKMPI